MLNLFFSSRIVYMQQTGDTIAIFSEIYQNTSQFRRVEPNVMLVQRRKADLMRFAFVGVRNFRAVQQRAHNSYVLAQGLRARWSQTEHAHRGIARAEDGEGPPGRERVDGRDAVRSLRRYAHPAYRNACADLDRARLHRHGRHRRKQIRAQQRTVGDPAARETEPLTVLCIIDGRDVAEANAEFQGFRSLGVRPQFGPIWILEAAERSSSDAAVRLLEETQVLLHVVDPFEQGLRVPLAAWGGKEIATVDVQRPGQALNRVGNGMNDLGT